MKKITTIIPTFVPIGKIRWSILFLIFLFPLITFSSPMTPSLQGMGGSGTLTINIRNAYAREAFQQIMQKTNMKFVYAEKNVSKQTRVSLSYPKSERVTTVLQDLCRQLNLDYQIKGNLIMLYPHAKGKKHKLTLHLTSSDDNEPMPMARCELQPLSLNAVTDMEGNVTIHALKRIVDNNSRRWRWGLESWRGRRATE